MERLCETRSANIGRLSLRRTGIASWAEIGIEEVEGHTVIGIDFGVNGKDPETGGYDYFDWCGLKVFHDPSGFGELFLAGRRSE